MTPRATSPALATPWAAGVSDARAAALLFLREKVVLRIPPQLPANAGSIHAGSASAPDAVAGKLLPDCRAGR
jgi:hypothetical protein